MLEFAAGVAVLVMTALLLVIPVATLVLLCRQQRLIRDLQDFLYSFRASLAPEKTPPRPEDATVPPAAPPSVGRGGPVAPPASVSIPPASPARLSITASQRGSAGTPRPTTEQSRSAVAPSPVEAALSRFFDLLADWLAVRGEFAPEGVTHEFAFATRWLVRIGILLVLGCVVFFLKWSIDQGWVGPAQRVASTLLSGTAAVAGGIALVRRTRYGLIGHAVAAAGFVALYLGFGLGLDFFVPPVFASRPLVFAALVGVTFFAGFVAVYLRSAPIAFLGLVGGYLTPFIAGTDTGHDLPLYGYLLVLGFGALAVSVLRRWSALDLLAAVLAYVACFLYCGRHGGAAFLLHGLVFLTAAHLLYLASTVVGGRLRGKAGDVVAWVGIILNAAAYVAWLSTVFRPIFHERAVGLVFLGLVAVYVALAAAGIRRGWIDALGVRLFLALSMAFLSFAPFLLLGRPWLVLAWCAIAVAAARVGRAANQKVLTGLALALLVCACLRSLFVDSSVFFDVPDGSLVSVSVGSYLLNLALRMIRIGCVPAALAFIGRDFARTEEPARGLERVLVVASFVAVFLYLTAEASLFGRCFLPAFHGGTVTLTWAAFAFGLLFAGIRRRQKSIRVVGLVLLSVVVVKLLLFDTAVLATPWRVLAFGVVGMLLVLGAFLYLKFRKEFEDHA